MHRKNDESLRKNDAKCCESSADLRGELGEAAEVFGGESGCESSAESCSEAANLGEGEGCGANPAANLEGESSGGANGEKGGESSESESAPAENPAANLNALLAQKDSQIKELEERYIRAYADFENTKRRLEREKSQALEYANEGFARDLLPVLDTLESALNGVGEGADETSKNIANGIRLTIENFLKVLSKHGAEALDSSGDFDPNIHNAILQVKDESRADGEISQVMQKGYSFKGRLLRPAMVSITKNN